jgi:hypothetical protein
MNKIGVKTPRNGNDGGVIQPDAAWLPELSQGFASQAFTQQIVHNAPGRAVGTARRSGIMRSMRVLALAVEFAGLLCVVSRSGFATLMGVVIHAQPQFGLSGRIFEKYEPVRRLRFPMFPPGARQRYPE